MSSQEQVAEGEIIVDREFSPVGLEEAMETAISYYTDAMRLYDEALHLPRWNREGTKALQDRANRLVADTVLIGMVLDSVVPLSGDLYWSDQIQGEAQLRMHTEKA